MGYREILFSKNGIATYTLAREFLKYNVGDKIPTVSEFSETFDLARGTVQNAIKMLQQSDAIRIESKGHVGSYLVKKNMTILLEFAGISLLVLCLCHIPNAMKALLQDFWLQWKITIIFQRQWHLCEVLRIVSAC